MTRGVTGGIWGIPLEVDLRDFWAEFFLVAGFFGLTSLQLVPMLQSQPSVRYAS